MTNFERIKESLSVSEYAQMRLQMNSCPMSRTQDECFKRLNSNTRSAACFLCWVDFLEESND